MPNVRKMENKKRVRYKFRYSNRMHTMLFYPPSLGKNQEKADRCKYIKMGIGVFGILMGLSPFSNPQ